jgi:hypothetical protein
MRRGCYGKLRPNKKKLALKFAARPPYSSVGEQNTKIKPGENTAQKKCGPGQPPEPHSYVVSCVALSPIGGATASARQRSRNTESRVRQSPLPIRHLAITNRQPHGWPAALSRSEEQKWGRRPQRPGNQSRLRAFSGFPPAIHPRESPATAGSAAIIRQAQELSRFDASTFSQIVVRRNSKKLRSCAEAVEDETSLWKIEENSELNPRLSLEAHGGTSASAVLKGEADQLQMIELKYTVAVASQKRVTARSSAILKWQWSSCRRLAPLFHPRSRRSE